MGKLTTKKLIGRSVLLFIIFIIVFFILNFKTNFFCIKNKKVFGTKILDENQIVLASGLKADDNIFVTSKKELEMNIEKHPYVKKAIVKKRLPNKVIINVEEREEFVEIRQSDFYVYIDEEGSVLKVVSERLDKSLPILVGLNVKKSLAGESIEFEENLEIQSIIELLTELKKNSLASNIKVIEIAKDFSIKLKLENITVAFGDFKDIKYKVSFLNEILQSLSEKGLEKGTIYFDKGKNPVFIQGEM